MRRQIRCKNCDKISLHHAHGLCVICYKHIQYLKNSKLVCLRSRKRYAKCKEQINQRSRILYKENHLRYLADKKDRYYNHINNVPRIKNDKRYDLRYWVYAGGRRVHTVIAEKRLGRKLKSNECVHHIDGNGLNNKHTNLIICNRSYHAWLHKVFPIERNE